VAINRDKVLEAAQKFVEKKKYDKAVVELQKLVQADPNDARTLLKIGDLQQKMGAHAEAISTYESVGKLYSNQGFALKAIAVYKQIREIIAKYVPHLEEKYGHIAPKLADLYQQLGLTSDALAALDEVATRLQRQQRDPEAIEVFRRIVELDPTNPLPHLRLAEALSRVNDIEGAVMEFKTAGSQLAGIGRRDDAIKVLERLLHHKPDADQAKICAELYLSRGQPQDGMQALAKLQICFQANPRDFDTLSLLARAFNAIGQGAKAIEVQKEMARVARDTGKTDLFREIVERLNRVAPHDDGVKKLTAQLTAQPTHQSQSGFGAGAAAMHQTPGGMSGSYPNAPPPPTQSNPFMAPQPPPGFGPGPGGRPGTQPIQRPPLPQSDPYLQSRAATPDPIEEEVDEVSYEEVEPEEVVEEDALVEAGEGDASYEVGGTYEISEEEQAAADGDYGGTQQPYGEYADPNSEPSYTPDQPPVDTTEQIQKVLADANAFRRVRLYAKALETLRAGLDIDPRSMDVHEVYRDVLIEAGQTEDAVQEMLAIAALYVDALDGDSAARALQDVLAFDPQNVRAIEMLQELGYEIVDENEDGAMADDGPVLEPSGESELVGDAEVEYAEGETDDSADAYAAEPQHGQPPHGLPAYDFDDPGHAPDATPEYAYGEPQPQAEGYGADDGALPSFPLDEPVAEEHVHNDDYGGEAYTAAVGQRLPSVAPSVPPAAQDVIAQPTPSMAAGAGMELEDALDEAEFFCSRGLFEDARAILSEQLSRHPKHPLLRERLAEIDAQEQARGSGAREKPQQDRAYDIAASLDALESLDYGKPAEGFANEEEQVDVEEVFQKFKEGVEKQISVDDSDSHYNLGIAYKEMMLIDDAIREFDVAARDPKRECVCRSMIGMLEIERGRVNEAIEAFKGGLNAPIKDPQQETVLCYELGAAYEFKKQNKDALSYFQKAMRRDPNYRDVQERVRRLAKSEPAAPVRQVAVGADDEFDRAFDDLLSK
jgi:pilus assembly protein FimV